MRRLVVAVFASLFCSPVYALDLLYTVPQGWEVQNYVGTGSPYYDANGDGSPELVLSQPGNPSFWLHAVHLGGSEVWSLNVSATDYCPSCTVDWYAEVVFADITSDYSGPEALINYGGYGPSTDMSGVLVAATTSPTVIANFVHGRVVDVGDYDGNGMDEVVISRGQTLPFTYEVWGDASATTVPTHEGKTSSLEQSRPNPFREKVTIDFTVDRPGPASIDVLDVAGRRVFTRDLGSVAAGRHEVTWDGRAAEGTRIAPGAYFYRIVIAGEAKAQRMVHIR